MTFASPLGLLALLSLPAIVFLHLFRRSFRVRRVAGLFLWAPDRIEADAGRTRTRLLKTPSFWLEMAAALFGSLWLGGLSFGAGGATPHLVVVLDDSASMGARVGGATVVERAREKLEAIVDAMPAHTVVTTIRTGPRPDPIGLLRAPVAMLDEALDDWDPQQPAHDPAPALVLGLDYAGPDGRLVFLTDRPAPGAPRRSSVHALGEAAPNAAVLAARRAEGRLFFDVMAFADAPVETSIRLETDGGASADRAVTLTPGRPTHLSLDDVAPDRPVTLRLADDALAIDNEATLLPVRPRIVSVANLLPAATAEALRLDEVLAALENVRVASDPQRARILLAAAPGRLGPGRAELVLAPPGAERDAWIGPFLVERRHALLEGITLEGVVWSAGRGALPGLPLVTAGEQVLLAEEADAGGTRLRLNLDPARSNLATSPDWPILLSNLVEHARTRLPGPGPVNLRLGQLIAYRGPSDGLRLVDPAGRSRPARGTGLVTFEPRRAGLHRLLAGEREIARYSVQFVDARESDLSGAQRAFQAEEETARAGAPGGDGRGEQRVLALLLALCLVADWFVLGRPR